MSKQVIRIDVRERLAERRKAASRQFAGQVLARYARAGGAHGRKGYDRNRAKRDFRRMVREM